MKNKTDIYLRETILEIMEDGCLDQNPRAKWQDGTPAHSKFVTQKVFEYDISKGEYPITSLRTTALKGAFHDIEAIYLKQTNILEDMHPSIRGWWKDFCHNKWFDYFSDKEVNHLGQTYGRTVGRYDLMNKLLKGLEENPFGRRHSINLNQEQQKIDDPQALQPCAFETLWSVREKDKFELHRRYLDITLIQRSMDFVVTSSINPAQYTMLAMMVANHLTSKTGILHKVGKLLHIVQNCHIYDRHFDGAKEILERESTELQPKIELICESKDFYQHTIDDFKFSNLEGIKPLSSKLEIAV